jgi:hypothetical protein
VVPHVGLDAAEHIAGILQDSRDSRDTLPTIREGEILPHLEGEGVRGFYAAPGAEGVEEMAPQRL